MLPSVKEGSDYKPDSCRGMVGMSKSSGLRHPRSQTDFRKSAQHPGTKICKLVNLVKILDAFVLLECDTM